MCSGCRQAACCDHERSSKMTSVANGGRCRIPSQIAYLVDEDSNTPRIYLVNLATGVPAVLIGSAAVIWAVAADGSADVVDRVAEALHQPTALIRADVVDCLTGLVESGYLQAC